MMRERDSYYRIARRYTKEDMEHRPILEKNNVNSTIKSYTTSKIKTELTVNKNNHKTFWASIQELLPNNADNTANTLYNTEDDHLVENLSS